MNPPTISAGLDGSLLTSNAEKAKRGKLWCLNKFKVEEQLGEGAFGCVYVAREKKTKNKVAIKVMKKFELLQTKGEILFRREIENQSNVRGHPNILRMLAYFYDDLHLYLILEYCQDGDLVKILKKNGSFNERISVHLLVQVASAVAYCHGRKVIHRDIKLEN